MRGITRRRIKKVSRRRLFWPRRTGLLSNSERRQSRRRRWMDGGNNSYRRNFPIQRLGGAERKGRKGNGNSILPTLKLNRLTDRPTARTTRGEATAIASTTAARWRYAAVEEKTNSGVSVRGLS